jgi:hypothetical protein
MISLTAWQRAGSSEWEILGPSATRKSTVGLCLRIAEKTVLVVSGRLNPKNAIGGLDIDNLVWSTERLPSLEFGLKPEKVSMGGFGNHTVALG